MASAPADALSQLAAAVRTPVGYASRSTSRTAGPVIIQLTAKKWKAHQLFAALWMMIGMCCVAVGGVIADARGTLNPILVIGGVAFVIGFIWYVVARTMAWWHHG